MFLKGASNSRRFTIPIAARVILSFASAKLKVPSLLATKIFSAAKGTFRLQARAPDSTSVLIASRKDISAASSLSDIEIYRALN
jgi:hypothetical protein